MNALVELNHTVLKAKLAAIITHMIAERQWTQQVAAENLKVSQPRISNLLAGYLDRFSIDFLLDALGKLGYKFDLDYTPENKIQPMTLYLKKGAL